MNDIKVKPQGEDRITNLQAKRLFLHQHAIAQLQTGKANREHAPLVLSYTSAIAFPPTWHAKRHRHHYLVKRCLST